MFQYILFDLDGTLTDAAPGELESAGADFLANTPEDIFNTINCN